MSRETVRLRLGDEGYRLVGADGQPLADANAFLAAQQSRGLSEHTIRAYGYDLVTLLRWLASTGKHLAKLEGVHLLGFIDALRGAGAQPSSINRRLTTTRLYFRFCTGRDIVADRGVTLPAPHYKGPGRDRHLGLHPLRPVRRHKLTVKMPRKVVEPLDRKQVLAFVRSLRRYRDLAIVYLMLLCGLRSVEVIAVEVTDLAFDDRQLRVRGKGNRQRMLPLPDLLVQVLRDYIRLERPSQTVVPQLFVVLQGRRRGQAMTPAGLRSLFRNRRLMSLLSSANAHRFRHTFGADMARSGVRLPILQRMMGHADGKTTLQYIELSMADIADEYQRAIGHIQRRYET